MESKNDSGWRWIGADGGVALVYPDRGVLDSSLECDEITGVTNPDGTMEGFRGLVHEMTLLE